jgi:hypothetical protein
MCYNSLSLGRSNARLKIPVERACLQIVVTGSDAMARSATPTEDTWQALDSKSGAAPQLRCQRAQGALRLK